MGKRLFITEKPSVAASFAQVLNVSIQKQDRARGFAENSNHVITWCFGHLVTLAYPNAYDAKYNQWKEEHLPIIPDQYIYTVIQDDGIKKQFETIRKLFHRKDITEIVVCTDSGREGEYIFRLVYLHSQCQKPALRVWISSQTEEAISEGIQNAKSIKEYDSLSISAFSRAKEDWLFGMNFSRIYTLQYGWQLSKILQEKKQSVIAIGRVMTCVLGLIVERELEIRSFVPTKHYGISVNFQAHESNMSYEGKWQAAVDNNNEQQDPYISKEVAEKIAAKLEGKDGKIKTIEKKNKTEQPPFLFNLSELQAEANKKFKLPVDKTLAIAQELYEKKLITYPRTDCKVLPTDILPELPKVLNALYKLPVFVESIIEIKNDGTLRVNKNNKRYVDNSKVTDHYAIIPTYITPNLHSFSADIQNVYLLIAKRFLAAFFPPAKFATTKIETLCEHELFITNMKTLTHAGWKKVYDVSAQNEDTPVDISYRNLKTGNSCSVTKLNIDEKETRAPSRYTDGSLVLTMEKAGKLIEDEELREQIKTTGIGTSATRAGIIKKLKDIGHIKIHPKTQIVTPTTKGEAIVRIVQKTAKELLSPVLTASWEKGLLLLEQKETTEECFHQKLNTYINKTIQKVKNTKLTLTDSNP